MNAMTALLTTPRLRHIALPALLGAGALSCNLALDIDKLDRGTTSGSAGSTGGASGGTGGTGGSAAGGTGGSTGTGGVEVLATGQCNPGSIAVANGYVYWTTGYDPKKVTDTVCVGMQSSAIRRLPLGPMGTPANVAMNIDQPRGLTILDGEVYWSTETSKICKAGAGGVDQGCQAPMSLPETCKTYSLASLGGLVYFHAGPCVGNSEIRSYDPKSYASASLGISVVNNFVGWMAISPGALPWIAWRDACPANKSVHRINVARLGNPGLGWSHCFATGNVQTGAVDQDALYWIDPDDSTLNRLPLSDNLKGSDTSSKLVTELPDANGVTFDDKYIYVTSDTLEGSVLYLPKATGTTKTLAEIGVVAKNRKGAHGGQGIPFAITAEDPDWLYWALSGQGYSIERAHKPI